MNPFDFVSMSASGSIVLLLVLILTGASLYFSALVIRKCGYSAWWALIGLVPLVNLIMLWIFAFARWPAYPER